MIKPNQVFLEEKLRPIKRSIKLKCQLCSLPFSILKKQHICKRCLRSVCSDDSPFKRKQFEIFNDGKDHRLCKDCLQEQQAIEEYIKMYKIQLGTDCLLTKKIGNHSVKKNSNKSKIINDFTIKRQFISLQNLMKSLNVSFRVFVGKLITQSGKKLTQVTDLINWGLSEILTMKTGPIDQIVYIFLFFIAHCSIQSAIFFTIQTLKIINQINQNSEHQIISQIGQIIGQKKIGKNNFQNIGKVVKKQIYTLSLNCLNILFCSQILMQSLKQKNQHPFIFGLGFVMKEYKNMKQALQEKEFQIQLQKESSLIVKKKIFKFQYSHVEKKERKMSTELLQEYQKLKKQYSQIQKKLKFLQKQNQQLKITLKNKQIQFISFVEQKALSSKVFNQQEIGRCSSISPTKSICKCISQRNYTQKKSKTAYQVDTSMLQLLKQKNDQIRRLNQAIDQIKNNQTFSNKQFGQASLKLQQKQIQKYSSKNLLEQNQELKKINTSLLQKLTAITNKLMDNQQQQIKSANQWFSQSNQKNEGSQNVQIFQSQYNKQNSNRKTSTSSVGNAFSFPKIKKWGIFKYLD